MNAATKAMSKSTHNHLNQRGSPPFNDNDINVARSVYNTVAARIPSAAPVALLIPRRVLMLLMKR